VTSDPRRARDLELLDALDRFQRKPFEGNLWRVCRDGRDPLQGGPSASRWCNGEFDVLYTCLERDGALAEIHSLLSLQPVFPSKLSFRAHRLSGTADGLLHLADATMMERLGVDTARYTDRDYRQTQKIADAAYFLGFDGMIVPSARWPCMNAVLFTDRIEPSALAVQETEADQIDWATWRAKTKGQNHPSRDSAASADGASDGPSEP